MTGDTARSVLRAAGAVGTIAAVALTVHTAVNLRLLRRLDPEPGAVTERVSVLVPARNEAHRISPTIRALLQQINVPDLEILVLDDGSDDGTADVVRRSAHGDDRLSVRTGSGLPPGWLGKTHACHQLAGAATGSVLVFVDADVILDPPAVAAAVGLMRAADLDAVSPYPRQLADGIGPRLVQPLIEWSWMTTLPLRAAERSPRPSLVAATGQFFVVDRHAYDAAGGHAAVATEVLDDVGLLRAVKRAGGRGVAVDGSAMAQCRMYDTWDELVEGYTKSLWTAFGSPAGAAAVVGTLALAYVLPPVVGVLAGSAIGWIGYGAGVLGRTMVAGTTGQPVLPDVLAHPASVVVFGYLVASSLRRHRRGTLTWKGRTVG